MNIWIIQLLPKELIILLGPTSLMIIGFLVEKHYTGRITMFANAIALVSFFAQVTTIPLLIILYINIATILGIIGLASYSVKFPLFEAYYHFGKFFSSAITGIVLLYGLTLI